MMKLRTQLILAFLLLAVIPLSGLTVYSYVTSVNAFKKAAEAEAMDFSSELERRFQRIIQVINEEVESVLKLHYDELVSSRQNQLPPETEKAVARFYQDIGSLAPYIRSLEIAVPGADASAGKSGQDDSGDRETRRPSSMIMSFSDLAPERGANNPARNGAGDTKGEELPKRPFIIRDRPWPKPDDRKSQEEGREAPSQPLGGSDTREFIRELIFNRLTEGRSPERIFNNGTAGDQRSMTLPQLYTSPYLPPRREASLITRNPEFNFDSPLSMGGGDGLLRADINGPLLMREVMQVTMRDGDIPFVLDREGKVITTDENHQDLVKNLSLEAGTYTKLNESSGEWLVSARQSPRSGRTVGILRPVSGELQAVKKTAMINLSFGAAACILALLAIYPLSRGFTRQLGELMSGVKRLSLGDLEVRVPVTTGNEFGRLAQSFNQMAVDLKHHQAEKLKHEGLKRELALCREIQKGLLPGNPLRGNRIELQGVSIPAREVGGDFFNYFPLPENRTALLIGDVSGKGVPAALLMANIQAKLQAKLPLGNSLALMAQELDNDIYASTLPENYLTLFAGILDYAGETLHWINAGHNTQYLLRREGRLEKLPSTGRPLGLLPGGGYIEIETRLEPGDTIFLFTDGLPDAENENGEFFGEESLEKILLAQTGKPVNQILRAVEEAIRSHSGSTLASDDASMLVLRTG